MVVVLVPETIFIAPHARPRVFQLTRHLTPLFIMVASFSSGPILGRKVGIEFQRVLLARGPDWICLTDE